MLTAPANNTSTNEESVHIAGTGQAGMTVSIIKDGIGAGVTTVAPGGSFALEVPIDQGNNILSARIANDCNTIKESQDIRVHRNNGNGNSNSENGNQASSQSGTSAVNSKSEIVSQPTVNDLHTATPPVAPVDNSQTITLTPTQAKAQEQIITQPKADQTVSSERLWVTGKTTPFSTVDVYINATIVARVIAAADGIYGVLVGIQSGGNTIQVQATSKDGTVTVRTINIKLDKSLKPGAAVTAQNGTSQTIATIGITAIATGGFILTGILLWHTHTLRLRMRKHSHVHI
jgi:hypothetical protein